MNSRMLKRLIGLFTVGMLVVVAVACGSQEADEPAPDDGPAVSQAAASPQPEPTTPPKSTPSPEPTEAPAASSGAQRPSDPGGDDADPFSISSIVENGRRYEVTKVLSKDAIPAIFKPHFITPDEAINQYRDTDLVIGLSIGDEHRAYNVAYLSAREIVNDIIGDKPIAVTW